MYIGDSLMYGDCATRFHMAERDREPMKDVSHTPPNGDSVTNVWERGAASTESTTQPADD